MVCAQRHRRLREAEQAAQRLKVHSSRWKHAVAMVVKSNRHPAGGAWISLGFFMIWLWSEQHNGSSGALSRSEARCHVTAGFSSSVEDNISLSSSAHGLKAQNDSSHKKSGFAAWGCVSPDVMQQRHSRSPLWEYPRCCVVVAKTFLCGLLVLLSFYKILNTTDKDRLSCKIDS